MRGRHQVFEAASLAAVRLQPRVLAVGHREHIETLLSVAAGEAGSWLTRSEFARALGAERWLASHTAAIVGHLPPRARRHMERGLAAIGGRRLGVGVERGAAGVTLAQQTTTAEAHILYPDPAAAHQAAEQAMPVLNRANFLLRLLGTVVPLERTQVAATGERVALTLKLNDVEVRGLVERIDWLLEARTPECGVRARAVKRRSPG
jgi:hypothetical protein